jgi:hypothetical protein
MTDDRSDDRFPCSVIGHRASAMKSDSVSGIVYKGWLMMDCGVVVAETVERTVGPTSVCAVKRSGCPVGASPTRLTQSLQPEAIEAVVEATKPPEPSRKRVVKRLGEFAGRNASERRAGLERSNVEADPPLKRGRP